jgi:orotidine-5'-phosphate decarboxylase
MSLELSEQQLKAKARLCVPLDVPELPDAKRIIDATGGLVGIYKVNSIYAHAGHRVVKFIHEYGAKAFLDLKWHDIPNTVANYAEAAIANQVDIFNVHAQGGIAMMKAAKDHIVKRTEEIRCASAEIGGDPEYEPPTILGVTLLTSIDQKTLNEELGVPGTAQDYVLRLAKNAETAGLDGIVCSGQELGYLSGKLKTGFKKFTPGIKAGNRIGGDQKRVSDAAASIKAGADVLVVGRAITQAPDMHEAALKVLDEIASVI